MNELKPEDVMEEAECCGYATGCTDCVLAKYDRSPCIVKKALALLREKDAEIKGLVDGWSKDQDRFEKVCAEKDVEIERLTEERDKAQAICVQMGKLNQAEIAKARAEAITEFEKRLKAEAVEVDVSMGYGNECWQKAVTEWEIDRVAKEMKGDQR